MVAGSRHEVKRAIARLIASGKMSPEPDVATVHTGKPGSKTLTQVCPHGTTPQDTGAGKKRSAGATQPAGPPYSYSESPSAIATRLGTHLHDRVTGLGLTISYTRPFSQESTNPDSGQPGPKTKTRNGPGGASTSKLPSSRDWVVR